MMICVLAGLNSRLAGEICVDSAGCCEIVTSACCEGVHEAGSPVQSRHDGDDCPKGLHHHHVGCVHGFVLGLDPEHPCRPGAPVAMRAGFHHQGDTLPEDPFLSSEKPPLI